MYTLEPTRALAASVFVLLLAASGGAAQEPLRIPRIDGPVRLDGRPDEPVWLRAERVPLTMFRPTNGGPPSEPTEVRLAHDGEHLYLAGDFHDSEGGRVSSLTRDDLDTSDAFRILLDTFDDNENGLIFGTNPAGVRWDASVSGDGEWGRSGPSGPVNDGWNTIWDVATTRSEDGWTAEVRIPFSSLRFQARDGRTVMGLIVLRKIARRNEIATFPAISDQWQDGYIKPSLARDVVLEGVRGTRPVRATPYLLGGAVETAALDEGGPAYRLDGETTREAGIDVKLGVTDELTLDVTVNTDFAQVEADDEQVNLSRFSLFRPEKRQFFLERAGVFDFSTGGVSRLFHSRRIGLTDDGRPLRILGGARVVGKVGAWDVGVLDMQTAATEERDGENFGVLRVRRPIFNTFSYLGGMATTRIGRDGSRNLAFGLDGSVRASTTDDLSAAVVSTVDQTGAGPVGDASLAMLRWDRLTTRGFGGAAMVRYAGADYDPGVGFIDRTGFIQLHGSARYGIFAAEDSRLRRHFPNVFADAFLRSDDRSLESAAVQMYWNFEFRSGLWAWIGASAPYERLAEPFEIAGGARIAPGRYTSPGVNVGMMMPGTGALRTRGRVSLQRFYGGTLFSASIGPGATLGPHLALDALYDLRRIRLPDQPEPIRADIARLDATIALNKAFSLAALVQHNALADAVTGNLRARYNFGEGRDLYIVLDGVLNTDRDGLDPRPPLTQRRSLVVKYTYTVAN